MVMVSFEKGYSGCFGPLKGHSLWGVSAKCVALKSGLLEVRKKLECSRSLGLWSEE